MSWFVFALISTFGWGVADLFYMKGTDENDTYSHLKIAVWVGFVMGVGAVVLSLFLSNELTFNNVISNGVKYLPASLSYIISMVIGYAGLRYLELSIVSPVQNASGALSTIFMCIYFLIFGKDVLSSLSIIDYIGTIIIVIGVVLLAIFEKRLSKDANKENDKYKFGALALLFPLLYCVFDTIGTAADGIILDGEMGLGLSEIDVLIIYGVTFFIFGFCCWIYLLFKTKSIYNPFAKKEFFSKGIASFAEEFGQIFYVYAMAKDPILSAPMIASYCIVSVILSRIFLKEKLQKPLYICIVLVIIGIVLLGISEGINA